MDEFLLEQQYKYEEWLTSLFDRYEIDEDAIYYGDCETNMLDEQIAQELEAMDRVEDEDDGGYEVDPIEEAIWQESLKLEASLTHHTLYDYGSDN